MATPVVFAPVVTGLPFSGTDHNNNLAACENSFSDVATYVISGLTIAAGSGLSVNVAAGVAVTGCEVTKLAFVIGGLPASQPTVHLYLNQDGTGTSNLTGISPAKAVKLGTAVTGVATVTSVAMGRTSGRQQFVQPQNLVLGGPAAGTTSAGHPRAANLASWNATQAEGFELFGTLPAGALPSAFTAPATFQVTDAGTTNEPTIMTWQHRTSGTPAASFGNTVLFRADNASNSLADQLSLATGWSAATAGAESSLAIFSIRRAGVNTEVMRLNATGNGRLQLAQDFAHVNAAGAVGFFNATPITQPVNTTDLRTAIINLGFLASGGATPLNLNGGPLTAAMITSDTDLTVTGSTPIFVLTGGDPGFGRQTFISWKASGSVDFKDRFGNLWWQYDSTVPIVRYQSTLTVQAGAFSLSTSCATPKVVGNAFSTHQLTLDESGYNLVAQVGSGMATDVGFTIRGTASQTGELLRFEQLSSTSAIRTVCQISPVWVDSTDATRKARTVFYAWDTAAREGLRIEASGTAAMIGFLGAAAVVRQTAAAAATDLATVITLANSLRTGLIANGLFV